MPHLDAADAELFEAELASARKNLRLLQADFVD
jgi:hypothetical protein